MTKSTGPGDESTADAVATPTTSLASANHLLLKIYEPAIRERFKYHPRRDEIVRQLMRGNMPYQLVDLYFAEAEHYTWQHLNQRTKPEPNSDGYVTFQIYRDKSEAPND